MKFIKKIKITLLIPFLCNIIFPPLGIKIQSSHAQEFEEMNVSSQALEPYRPPLLRGMEISPLAPFDFKFIVDAGDTNQDPSQLKETSKVLIQFFLAGLAFPGEDLWVNLSPDEPGRIIPKILAKTNMGQTMLRQDYFLKQMIARELNPHQNHGRQFWEQIYAQTYNLTNSCDIPLDIMSRIWIVPQTAVITQEEDHIYVHSAPLKVMIEDERKNFDKKINTLTGNDLIRKESLSLLRQNILPRIEHYINNSQAFAPLRQIIYSLVLARWYKDQLSTSFLGQHYANQKKISGIDTKTPNSTQELYQAYIQSFQKESVPVIFEQFDPQRQKIIPRKYFSGGITGDVDYAMITKKISTPHANHFMVQGAYRQYPSPPQNLPSLKHISSHQPTTPEEAVLAWENFLNNDVPPGENTPLLKNVNVSLFVTESDHKQWKNPALGNNGMYAKTLPPFSLEDGRSIVPLIGENIYIVEEIRQQWVDPQQINDIQEAAELLSIIEDGAYEKSDDYGRFYHEEMSKPLMQLLDFYASFAEKKFTDKKIPLGFRVFLGLEGMDSIDIKHSVQMEGIHEETLWDLLRLLNQTHDTFLKEYISIETAHNSFNSFSSQYFSNNFKFQVKYFLEKLHPILLIRAEELLWQLVSGSQPPTFATERQAIFEKFPKLKILQKANNIIEQGDIFNQDKIQAEVIIRQMDDEEIKQRYGLIRIRKPDGTPATLNLKTYEYVVGRLAFAYGQNSYIAIQSKDAHLKPLQKPSDFFNAVAQGQPLKQIPSRLEIKSLGGRQHKIFALRDEQKTTYDPKIKKNDLTFLYSDVIFNPPPESLEESPVNESAKLFFYMVLASRGVYTHKISFVYPKLKTSPSRLDIFLRTPSGLETRSWDDLLNTMPGILSGGTYGEGFISPIGTEILEYPDGALRDEPRFRAIGGELPYLTLSRFHYGKKTLTPGGGGWELAGSLRLTPFKEFPPLRVYEALHEFKQHPEESLLQKWRTERTLEDRLTNLFKKFGKNLWLLLAMGKTFIQMGGTIIHNHEDNELPSVEEMYDFILKDMTLLGAIGDLGDLLPLDDELNYENISESILFGLFFVSHLINEFTSLELLEENPHQEKKFLLAFVEGFMNQKYNHPLPDLLKVQDIKYEENPDRYGGGHNPKDPQEEFRAHWIRKKMTPDKEDLIQNMAMTLSSLWEHWPRLYYGKPEYSHTRARIFSPWDVDVHKWNDLWEKDIFTKKFSRPAQQKLQELKRLRKGNYAALVRALRDGHKNLLSSEDLNPTRHPARQWAQNVAMHLQPGIPLEDSLNQIAALWQELSEEDQESFENFYTLVISIHIAFARQENMVRWKDQKIQLSDALDQLHQMQESLQDPSFQKTKVSDEERNLDTGGIQFKEIRWKIKGNDRSPTIPLSQNLTIELPPILHGLIPQVDTIYQWK